MIMNYLSKNINIPIPRVHY
jgi:hypothetical protein